jgi:predicted CXXCH cytochrome family protein
MRMNRRSLWVVVLSVSLAGAAIVWGRIPFPHARHVEAGVDCATCHPDAATSENLKTSLVPADTSLCTDCHEQADLEKWGWTTIPQRTTGFRTFPHKTHLDLGKTCEDCHGAMIHPEWAKEGKGVLGHALCFQCHDGVQHRNECETCHTNLHEMRLSDLEPDPASFQPMSHHPGFLHDHQFQVRLNGHTCVECHRQEDFCSTCHQGVNIVDLVHERNWLYTHPIAARKNLEDCASCHRIESYCTDCHTQNGVIPGDHLQAGWRTGLHAAVARRDMQLCASCHEQDEVCARCHLDPDGVLGTQAGLNPHPPGFRNDAGHGYWHEDENAACFSCHTVTVRQPGIGFCGYCHGAKSGK